MELELDRPELCSWLGVAPDYQPTAAYLGEVTDEGSLRDLIANHCARCGDDHAKTIHLIVEGTPEHTEASYDADFPWQLADAFEVAR